MRKNFERLTVLIYVLACAGLPAQGQEVGRFAVVQNDVTSLAPGTQEAVRARPGKAIVLDELETSGASSAAKMTVGDGAVVSIGQNTKFRMTRGALDEATGASVSTVDLTLGKLRVFVSRLWGGRPGVEVNTPTAVVGIKGSEVLVEVFQNGSCAVTVFSGAADVRSPKTGGRSSLRSGQQMQVSSSGELAGEPTSPAESELEALWQSTEPQPAAPTEITEERPMIPPQVLTGSTSSERIARNTNSQFSTGSTMSSPSSGVAPETLAPDRTINSGL